MNNTSDTQVTLNNLSVSSNIIRKKDDNGILVDSGATVHIFKRPEAFISWDKTFDPRRAKIILADGRVSTAIKARGKVRLQVLDSDQKIQHIILHDALLMPDLNHEGILSVKSGMKQGDIFFFQQGNIILGPGSISWLVCVCVSLLSLFN